MELITVWRVINNNDVLHRPSNPLHVLDEHILGVGTVFAEQTLRRNVHRVQDIHQRIGVFRKRGSEYDHFIVLADFLDEFAAVGTNLHVNSADAPFDIDREHDVVGRSGREGRVDEGLVDVEDQGFAAADVLRLRS